MWFGTYDGLNLYNGKNIYTYRFEMDNKNSLCSSIIHKITDADSTHLWISTFMGLNRFSLYERKVVDSFPEFPECRLIAADRQGKTLLLTRENQVSFYDPASESFYDLSAPGLSPLSVKTLFCLDDQFYFVHNSGVILQGNLMKKDLSFILVTHEVLRLDKPVTQAFYSDRLYCIDVADDLFACDVQKRTFTPLANTSSMLQKYGEVSQIQSVDEELFVAFKNNGLVKLSETMQQEYLPIKPNIGVFSLFFDRRQRILWIGTDGQGVYTYYEKNSRFHNLLLADLPFVAEKPVRALLTDDQGSLWIGTKGDGVIRIKDYASYTNKSIPDALVTQFTTRDGLADNQVFAFRKSRFSSFIWIGTENGLSYYSYQDDRMFVLPSIPGRPLKMIHSIVEVNDSTLWLATAGEGLYKVTIAVTGKSAKVKNAQVYVFQKDNRVINEFHSMVFDGDSLLYIGSRGGYGVIRMNVLTQQHEFLSLYAQQDAAIGDVLCVYPAWDSSFYLGASSGMTQIRMVGDEQVIRRFDRRNGLANDMIHGIQEDGNHCFWMSTNKGLIKFNPYSEFFHNYGSPDLAVTEFSDDAYWTCPFSGRLFFGGINGLVWVSPRGDNQEQYIPPLRFYESFGSACECAYPCRNAVF